MKHPLVNESLRVPDLHVEATDSLMDALVASENRMLRRVELLSEVVFETDDSGALVFLNKAWTTITGHPVADCLGRRLHEFVLEEDRSRCERIITGAVAEEGSSLRLLDARGGLIWMEISVSRTNDGGVVGALHNATRRKQFEDELAKLSLVASYTDNLVMIADRDGLTEWVNQAFITHSGYTLADMRGKTGEYPPRTGYRPGDCSSDQCTAERRGFLLRRADQLHASG
jgi:PAS domain S-box-containing protein